MRAVLRLAMCGADTRTDTLFLAGFDLANDMRVGDMGAGHRHHIEQFLSDGVAGRRDVGNAGGVENRQAHRAPEFADTGEPGRDRGGHARHILDCKRALGVHPAVDGIKEVEHSGALEQTGHLDAFLQREPILAALVDHIAHADDEFVAGLTADLLQYHQGEAAAVLARAAKIVGTPVGHGGEELADQVSASKHLDAVEPAVAAATGRRPIGFHYATDVVLVHFLREAAMQRLANRRRCDGWQPMRRVRLTAPAEMRDLHHQGSAMRMDALGEALQIRNDGVGTDIQLTENIGRIDIHIGRAAEHRQRDAALGLLLMIELVGFGWQAADFKPAGVTRAHDPIFEYERFDLQWLQKWITRRRC